MGLLYWLPLTTDLRNQGLNNTTVTNNGATYSATSGKLGGCYTSTSSSQDITINFTNLSTILANGKTYSLSCWVKPTGLPTSGWVIKLGDNSCGLYWAKSTARWVWNENDNGKRCANETISSDYTNWHHLAIVVDKTVSGKITTRQYVDGALAEGYPGSTWDNSSQAQPSGTTITIYPYVSYLNDIRIYDHCLTENEVKRIAQGLVLHYPLNRNGWGQENLVENSYSDWSNWITPTPDSQNQTSYASYVYWPEGYVRANGDKFTCQIEIEFNGVTAGTGGTVAFRMQGNSTSGWVGGNPWAYSVFSGSVPSNGIYKYKWTGSLNATTATDTWLRHGFRADYWGSGKYRYRFIKFEKGEIATPWCPNLSEATATTMGLNGTTEYDCSGLCNNGTRIGALDWTSDTPKYCVSTYSANGNSNSIVTPVLNLNPNEITINIWFKSTNTSPVSNYHMIVDSIANRQWYEMCVYKGGDFRAGLFVNGTRYAANCTSTNLLNGEWHMLTLSYDGATVKRYVDTVLESSTSVAISSGLSSPTALALFRDGPNQTSYACVEASLCDFRVYATALSQNDITSLYQNCATIGPDGTIYGKIRS